MLFLLFRYYKILVVATKAIGLLLLPRELAKNTLTHLFVDLLYNKVCIFVVVVFSGYACFGIWDRV